jgi:penicillin-binding protein 1A
MDGLIAYDQKRGSFRGPVASVDSPRTGAGRSTQSSPARRAGMAARRGRRDAGRTRPTIGLRPKRRSRRLNSDLTGDRDAVQAADMKWVSQAPAAVSTVLKPATWSMSQAVEGKPGILFSCSRSPRSRAHSLPWTRAPGACWPWSAASPSPRASSTAPPRRCASPAPRSSRFLYAAALDNGYTPASVVLDAPLEIRPGRWLDLAPGELRAASSTARRPCARGIERSRNVMTVRLAQDIGMPLIAEYAKHVRHLRHA